MESDKEMCVYELAQDMLLELIWNVKKLEL